MIVVINNRGFSFKGVTDYLAHDKKAQTSERVAWTETGNLYTNDIEKAARVMAWTDSNAEELKRECGGSMAGSKVERGAVYHYSISWIHDKNPDKEHQKEQVFATLEKLGFADNQYYMVAHNDTEHSHVHVVVNLTNQETGKRTDPHLDKTALQEWALEFSQEYEQGKHYCPKREENAVLRAQGKSVKYQNQKQDYSVKITRAYHASDSGKAFINALETEGLHLGKAKRGNSFVVVDEKGDIQKLSRQLDIEQRGKAKTTAINTKLADIDRNDVPDGGELSKKIKEERTQEPTAGNNKKLLEDISLLTQDSTIDVAGVISKKLDDELSDNLNILDNVKNTFVNLVKNDIDLTDEIIDAVITNAIKHEHDKGVVGGIPDDSSDNVIERLMGDTTSEQQQNTKDDDLLDRLMQSSSIGKTSLSTPQVTNNPFKQSSPFNQSNPFEKKGSDLFGQSDGIGVMVDAFKEELKNDTTFSDEEKSNIFSEVITEIEELTKDDINITSKKFESLKNYHISEARGIGR